MGANDSIIPAAVCVAEHAPPAYHVVIAAGAHAPHSSVAWPPAAGFGSGSFAAEGAQQPAPLELQQG
eukprot:CAMPEP_0117682400 /NCGR_PEP_ID=MMETSP0804-20121206/19635_1 /TAXON_ID=1074897 /ORGANISM="Tetraselmis astigmatica, Strain CCMP880" /LENGTH=66 /DNA_ID=CAMNT_0005492501 /DNA_START=623 /DNA_END=823 /DNA_ORIENTATION=-